MFLRKLLQAQVGNLTFRMLTWYLPHIKESLKLLAEFETTAEKRKVSQRDPNFLTTVPLVLISLHILRFNLSERQNYVDTKVIND